MSNKPQDKQLHYFDLLKIKNGENLTRDYFYVPVITYCEATYYDEDWYSLRFGEDKEDFPKSIVAYASKVPIGMSLKDAVRQDLTRDFAYPADKDFNVVDVIKLGVARDSGGNTLTRLLVNLIVSEKFSNTNISPANMTTQWFYEGESDINSTWRDVNNHFFKAMSLRDELIAAYKPFVRKGVSNPFQLSLKSEDNEAKRVTSLDAIYHEAMALLKEPLSKDDRILIEVEEMTVFLDAGFNEVALLDKIAHDWLMNIRSDAENIGRQDLVDTIQEKIDAIEYKIKAIQASKEML